MDAEERLIGYDALVDLAIDVQLMRALGPLALIAEAALTGFVSGIIETQRAMRWSRRIAAQAPLGIAAGRSHRRPVSAMPVRWRPARS